MTASGSIPCTHRRAVSYIDKSREYYAANGYERPYAWASYREVPFVPWGSAGIDIANATIGVVTTTFPLGHSRPKQVYAQASSPIPEAMFTDDLSWDKDATNTDDVGSFLPLAALNKLAADGGIGAVAERFYGIPTEYSQRSTHEDADRIIEWAREDGVDAMVLVPL